MMVQVIHDVMRANPKRACRGHRGLLLALSMAFLLGAGCSARAEEPPSDEYRVYEAVLKLIDSIPKTDPHVAIYDRTLSSNCDAGSNNPVLANGCTFLWVRPDTDQAVEQMLRRRFHGLERSTWKSFKTNNASSITLHDPIATPWKHRLVGTNPPVAASAEWDSPDMTIYLSRVGLNSKKTEAIVYVLAFSYLGRMAATGDYLRFRAAADRSWSLAGRVRYMNQDDDVFVMLRPHNKRNSTAAPYLPVAESK